MDSSQPPKPAHLLDDLEAIRELLEKDQLEPPLLTETLDDSLHIPLLSDIIEPGPAIATPPPAPTVAPRPVVQPQSAAPAPRPAPAAVSTPSAAATPSSASVMGSVVQRSLNPANAVEQHRLDSELRAAAQLILQDVIDDFVPQIEAELKRRLDARLDRLIKQPKP
ncbi:MAG: DNA polymerase III subunit chi [Pseudomonas sp.]